MIDCDIVCLLLLHFARRGKIVIDDIDISKIGLRDLRSKIAIIPQDARKLFYIITFLPITLLTRDISPSPVLFNGTIRTNLDPFGEFEDAVLWDALKRSFLVDNSYIPGSTAPSTSESGGRFSLDLVIEDEGLNLSVGERSLVSLARALVKDSRIIILDEATA